MHGLPDKGCQILNCMQGLHRKIYDNVSIVPIPGDFTLSKTEFSSFLEDDDDDDILLFESSDIDEDDEIAELFQPCTQGKLSIQLNVQLQLQVVHVHFIVTDSEFNVSRRSAHPSITTGSHLCEICVKCA